MRDKSFSPGDRVVCDRDICPSLPDAPREGDIATVHSVDFDETGRPTANLNLDRLPGDEGGWDVNFSDLTEWTEPDPVVEPAGTTLSEIFVDCSRDLREWVRNEQVMAYGKGEWPTAVAQRIVDQDYEAPIYTATLAMLPQTFDDLRPHEYKRILSEVLRLSHARIFNGPEVK